MSFLENCRRLIALDSTPGRGNKEAALNLPASFAKRPACMSSISANFSTGIEQCNVIARPRARKFRKRNCYCKRISTRFTPATFRFGRKLNRIRLTPASTTTACMASERRNRSSIFCANSRRRAFAGKLKRPFVLVANLRRTKRHGGRDQARAQEKNQCQMGAGGRPDRFELGGGRARAWR